MHEVRNAAEALACLGEFDFTAGVVDWRPASEDHRVVARALKKSRCAFSSMRPIHRRMYHGAWRAHLPQAGTPGGNCEGARAIGRRQQVSAWGYLLQACHCASLLSRSCYRIG